MAIGDVSDGAPETTGPDLGRPDLEIRREIARGGFGVVYEGHQPALNRTVAVKLVLAQVLDETTRLRFERECTAMGLLSDHPHIVTVFDAGFGTAGQPYILMDFMTGGSLADTIERGGPMPWPDVVSVTVKLSSALETAHRAGVLHRDIKPENVLWSAYGEPELGDFGIARLQGGPETRTDTLTASIAHVAPELLGGEPPSVSTDLYALGSTCYVLLSGRSAFLRDTDESIVPALTRITSEPVPDLRRDGVPDAVAAFVERLMAKDPADRFPSALEVAQHLQALQRGHGLGLTPLHVPGVPPLPGAAPASTDNIDVAGALELTAVGTEDLRSANATGSAGPPQLGRAEDPPATVGTVDAPGVGAPRGTEHAATTPVPVSHPKRRTPLLAAVAVVVVLAVIGGIVALARPERPGAADGPDPVAADPAVDADSVPDASQEPSEGQGAEDRGPGEALEIGQLAAQLAEVRGLPVQGNFDARRYSAAEYAPLIRAYADRAGAVDLAIQGRVLATLRLIPRDLDYPELVRSLWEEQLSGFYDETSARVHVRSDSPVLSPLSRSVLADELMLALLDQQFDLAALHERAGDSDADRAVTALAKGDTFVSSGVWLERFLTGDEQEQREADFGLLPDQVGRSVPPAVRGEFVFPFVGGPEFVRAIFGEGGVEGLDAVYADPPTTTEQILEPQKYLDGEPAIDVVVDATPGEGWEELTRRPFGAYDVLQLLTELDPEVGDAAAAGWGGGQLVAWTQDEQTVLAVSLEMDTAADAAELCAAVPQWYAITGGAPAGGDLYTTAEDAMALRCSGAGVRFAVAPEAALAELVVGPAA